MVGIIKAGTIMTPSAFTRERKDGSDCSGSDGAANRVLALAATPEFIIEVKLQGRSLHNTDEYTVSVANVTFLVNVDNDSKIEVVYV